MYIYIKHLILIFNVIFNSFVLFQVEDVVVAPSDYTAAADDEVSLKTGDIVEVLDTKSALGAK